MNTILSQDLILSVVSSLVRTGDSNGVALYLLAGVMALCLVGIIAFRKAFAFSTGAQNTGRLKKNVAIAIAALVFVLALFVFTGKALAEKDLLDVSVSPSPNLTISMSKKTGTAISEKVTIKNNEDHVVYLDSIKLDTDSADYGDWTCKYKGKVIYSGTQDTDFVEIDGYVPIAAGASVKLIWTAKLDKNEVKDLDGESLGTVNYQITKNHSCHEYEIHSDGEWTCVNCHVRYKTTHESYIVQVDEDGQPIDESYVELTDENVSETSVGAGSVEKTGNAIKYKNTSTKQTVVIRTDTFDTTLTIDAKEDEIAHYGYAAIVDINKVKKDSYEEHGKVGRIEIEQGHVEAMAGSEIFCLMESPRQEDDVKSTTINNGAIVHENMTNIKSQSGSVVKDTTTGIANGHVEDCGPGMHTFSQLVIDPEHVYDVCTCCGYTLIHVIDSDGTDIMQSKNTLDSNGYVQSEDVTPVEKYLIDDTIDTDNLPKENYTIGDTPINPTPTVDPDHPADMTCEHNWKITSNDDGTHDITCSKCHGSYTENCEFGSDHKCKKCGYECKHCQFNTKTKRLYYNCPYCDVDFGTEEIPYLLHNGEEFEAFVKLHDWTGYTGYYQVYREDKQGQLDYLYAELANDIDCSKINWPTGYSELYYLQLNGKSYKLKNINTTGDIFKSVKGYACIEKLNFEDCKMSGIWNSNTKGAVITNVNFKNCEFTGDGAFGKYLYYYADFDGVTMTDCKMNSFIKYPFYQDTKSDYKNLTFKNCNLGKGTFDQTYDSYLNLEDCTYDNCTVSVGTALVAYGGFSTYSKKTGIKFENVDIKNSKAYGGAYIYYGGSKNYPYEFNNCNVTNSEIYGGDNMALAGFVGNASSSDVSFENCTFDGTIESNSQIAAGFIGQPKWGGYTIKNCKVSEDTLIVNKDSGGVALFSGYNDNFNKDGNKFYGTVSSEDISKVTYNGFDSSQVKFNKYSNQLSVADFTVNKETGELKYVGENQFTKMVATNIITAFDNIVDDVGGYSWDVQEITTNTVSKNSVIGNLLIIDNLIQIVDEDHAQTIGASTTDASIIEGLSLLNDTYAFYYNEGTLIYDSRLKPSGKTKYVYSGTQNINSLPTTGHGSVLVQAFNGDDLVGSVTIYYFEFKLGAKDPE